MSSFRGTLYPYQQVAHDMIVEQGRALLGFEMGLGKTPTALAAMESLMDKGEIIEPGLVFTLSSLKYQWKKSVEQFTHSKALVIDGTPAQRAAQYEMARNWDTEGIDYVILNYEALRNDFDQISDLPRGFLILDESTAVKTITSKTHKAMHALSKGVDIKVGLTGTPMTNGKPDEIFNQLRVIHPSLLGPYQRFHARYVIKNQFGWITGYKNLGELHEKLKGVMISKKQADPDVAPYLPETIYRDPILVPLDRASAAVYNRVQKDLLADLDEAAVLMRDMPLNLYGGGLDGGGPLDEMRGVIASKVTALRMLCSHPDLLKHSAQQFSQLTGFGSQYIYELSEEGVLDKLKGSPKLDALARYVSDFLELDEDNKVVVFSVFVETLPKIQEALKRYGSVTYSGRMNAKEKEAARLQFQSDPKTRVFISSDAGGFGVDLPQANLLVNYDLPWASGTARQRNGRIQRASSEWEHVVIQNFLIEGSLEERQWEQLQEKSRIESAIVDGAGIDSKGGVAMNVGTLRAFLRENSI